VVVSPFLKGAIDHVPKDAFQPYPKLLRLVEAVRTHPKTVSWYARS